MEEIENKIKELTLKFNNDETDLLKSMYRFINQKYVLSCSEKVLKTVPEHEEFNSRIYLNVDKIYFDEIWNNYMRRKIDAIFDVILKVDIKEISEKQLKEIMVKTPVKEKANADSKKETLNAVLERIKNNKEINELEVIYICSELTNKNIFFINEFEKIINALRLGEKKYEYIYDTICADLDKTFSVFGFCNFKNDKCVSQRHKSMLNDYPHQSKDGCCFNVVKKCKYHNKDGSCQTKCLPCKLYTCPYLSKRGIGLYSSEVPLIRAFFNVKQKKDSIYRFFTTREKIIDKLETHA